MIWLYIYGALCTGTVISIARIAGRGDKWPHGIFVTAATVLITAGLYQLLIYFCFNIVKIVYLAVTGSAV